MGRLSGKIAIVTGASRGIGHGIASAMVAEGATVIGCDVVDFAPDHGLHAVFALDVTDESAWTRVVTETESRFGAATVLVNNAGVTGPEMIHETSLEEWNRVVGVNQTGVFLGMKSVIPGMRTAGGGAIVNISSTIGSTAVPGIAAYHASKGAVRLLTKNAAASYAADGIRANALLPGWIQTPMTAGQTDEVNLRFQEAAPLGRPGTPADVAGAAVFLASDEASFITGVDLPVDGGYLAV